MALNRPIMEMTINRRIICNENPSYIVTMESVKWSYPCHDRIPFMPKAESGSPTLVNPVEVSPFNV